MRLALVACVLGASAGAPMTALAAPVLRSAEVRVVFTFPASCTVELTVTVEPAGDVEHRVEVAEGTRVTLLEVRGAAPAVEPRDIGRTRVLVVSPEGPPYTLRYSVERPDGLGDRCPLWIPTVPADGVSQRVRIVVRIPAGATAVGTMPVFTWVGEEGTTTIGHLPAFVRVPFAMPGTPAPWNIARAMDVVSIATLLGATLLWARRRNRGHRA